VVPGEPAAALRDRLASLPVAEQAALRKRDGLHLVGFERPGELRRRAILRLRAYPLYAILHHAVHAGLAARVEVALHHLLHVLRRRLSERAERDERQQKREAAHRLLPGPRYVSPRAVAVRKWISATVVSEAKLGSGVRIWR